MRELKGKSKFQQSEIEALLEKFCSLATTSGEIAVIERATFKAALGTGDAWGILQDRMFAVFDAERHDFIYFPNFIEILSIIQRGSLQEKALGSLLN